MKGKDRSEAGIERTFDEGGRREDRRNGGREGSLLGKSRRGTEAARVWRGRCEFGGDWKRKFLSFPLERFGRFVLERNISSFASSASLFSYRGIQILQCRESGKYLQKCFYLI